MEDITFQDMEGNKLIGTLSLPRHARSIVIISHGFSSSKESKLYVELQNELNKAGLGTFRFDYYGHGPLYCKGSNYTVSKDVTLSKCVNSLEAAIRFVRTKGDYSIALMGSSFGGLISLIAASQDSGINALALKSPVIEPIGFWRERLGSERLDKWKEDGFLHYDELGENFELDYNFFRDLLTFNTLEMVKDISCPVLIVHGDADRVVPIKSSYELARIVNAEVEVVKGAEHSYSEPTQYSKMKDLIVDFLTEKMSPSKSRPEL